MARRKTKQDLDDEQVDLIFVFEGMDIRCVCDPDVYSYDEAAKLQEIVTSLSREIAIDKSYVDFPENKSQKTFIHQEAWDSVCALALVEHYVKTPKLSKSQKALLQDSYQLMAICYVEQCLDDLGYDTAAMCLTLSEGSKYKYEIRIDTAHAWKDYIGPWQTW